MQEERKERHLSAKIRTKLSLHIKGADDDVEFSAATSPISPMNSSSATLTMFAGGCSVVLRTSLVL